MDHQIRTMAHNDTQAEDLVTADSLSKDGAPEKLSVDVVYCEGKVFDPRRGW